MWDHQKSGTISLNKRLTFFALKPDLCPIYIIGHNKRLNFFSCNLLLFPICKSDFVQDNGGCQHNCSIVTNESNITTQCSCRTGFILDSDSVTCLQGKTCFEVCAVSILSSHSFASFNLLVYYNHVRSRAIFWTVKKRTLLRKHFFCSSLEIVHFIFRLNIKWRAKKSLWLF